MQPSTDRLPSTCLCLRGPCRTGTCRVTGLAMILVRSPLPSRMTQALFWPHRPPLSGQSATPQIQQSMQFNSTRLLRMHAAHTISYDIQTMNLWSLPSSSTNTLSNIFVQIVDFLSDFGNASQRAQRLDQKILQDAASVSSLLGDLVSLAVPQVYGSLQLTIGTDANGKFNESDVMMFMKNIGGEIPG